jgi:hypothetical protein
VCTPQAGTLLTRLAVGITAVKEMLRTHTTNIIVLSDRALVTANEADQYTVSTLKGMGINMVALPQETLYVMQEYANIQCLETEAHELQQ